jgi:hypothetical protein
MGGSCSGRARAASVPPSGPRPRSPADTQAGRSSPEQRGVPDADQPMSPITARSGTPSSSAVAAVWRSGVVQPTGAQVRPAEPCRVRARSRDRPAAPQEQDAWGLEIGKALPLTAGRCAPWVRSSCQSAVWADPGRRKCSISWSRAPSGSGNFRPAGPRPAIALSGTGWPACSTPVGPGAEPSSAPGPISWRCGRRRR